MKVLKSCLSRSWGGMEMFALTTAKYLLKRNHKVEILCYPDSKIHVEAKLLNIPIHTCKASGYFHPLEVMRLSSILKNGKYDIIHTQASKDLSALVPALKLKNLKTSLIMTKQVGSFITKKDIFHKWIYNRLDYALAISEVIGRNLLDTCPLTPEKVLLLHNAVDSNKFDPGIIDSKKVRDEFKISDDTILIGMLARFSWGKGHEEFLYAARELKQKYNNIKFIIIGEPSRGEDEYAQKIKKMAQDYDVSDIVIFSGFRKDTPEVLAALDIFAFPSHSEAFGIALVEAMSIGKPSVCSASDGVLDIAVDGETSYLFEKQNAKDFTSKLEKLILNKDLRTSFGVNARKRVIEHFDLERYTDKLIAIYENISRIKKL
jgi:glycosyltransferase involved in cell wall biosynthesis